MENHDKHLEDGIYVGNQIDKGNLKNPLSRALVNNFDRRLLEGVTSFSPKSIHEVGCGEARLSRFLEKSFSVPVLGTDFSDAVIQGNQEYCSNLLRFEQCSIYELDPECHRRDVIVCCEVLEHLEQPESGLESLKRLNARGYLLSVPREPVWRVLNVARGKYWGELGNTPGHLNHWSNRSFDKFLRSGGFRVKQWLNPFPWTMAVAELA